ncbi:hypothetical protein PsYK624_105020 [Phanerochaete sordida]|uniref:Uncharacterized protein n=1 Tax=Phanerochaete sordida TaxID=48140 RepID=A0A9P3LGY2_9APHY|nr:hypothetical protein PsYK624_105020 [Phanerochaete sordida]
MDDKFVRDNPEVAMQLLKVYDRLHATLSELEETRQANKALCADVARLQDGGLGAQVGSETVKELNDALVREREANTRLSGEIVELRHALFDDRGDGGGVSAQKDQSEEEVECSCSARNELAALQSTFSEVDMRLEQQIGAYNDMHERVVELEQEVKTAEQTSEARRQHIQDLEEAAQTRQEQGEGLQRRVEKLQQDLTQAKGDIYAQRQALEAREKQLGEEKEQLEKAHSKLHEELKEVHRRHSTELEGASQSQKEKCEGLQRRLDELRRNLTEARGDLDEQRQTFESRDQEMCQEKEQLEKAHLKLQEDFKEVSYKYGKYKKLAMDLDHTLRERPTRESKHETSEPSDVPPPLTPTSPPVEPSEPSPTLKPDVFASTDEQKPSHKSWRDTVDEMLQYPCLPLSDTSAPMHLPQHIRALQSGKVLWCPHRIVFTPSDGAVRLISPVARCKGAGAPTELDAPLNELQRVLHTRREVFYQTGTGICYIGTYDAVALGDVSAAEYVALPSVTQSALLRHTFPSKHALAATPPTGIARVRAAYAHGAFRAQYLALRFVRFNQPLADALFALAGAARPLLGPPRGPSSTGARERLPTPPDDDAPARVPHAHRGAEARGADERCAAPVGRGAKRPAPEGRDCAKRVRVIMPK